MLNTITLNTLCLNMVGVPRGKHNGGGSSGGGDIPSGYDEFITSDGLVFSASDEAFYVKL